MSKPRLRDPTTGDLRAGVAPFLGLGFGSGLARKAPGTFGTVAAVPIYIVLISLGDKWLWVATVIVIMLGPWICSNTAKRLDAHDHPAIVWDEIAGFFLTMAPFYFSVANLVAGFLLFRLFDILKPWPIRWIDQRVHGGLGIMLDDIIAALFSIACLWGLIFLNPFSLFR